MRPFWRILVPISVTLTLAALLSSVAVTSFHGIDNYVSPFDASLPRREAGAALSDTVVMFVVDGLRADFAPEMISFRYLASEGASFLATCELPSLSKPAAATLGTGAVPEVHGITSNDCNRSVAIDSLFQSAAASGVPTTVISTGSWDELFGYAITNSIVVPGEKGSGDRVIADHASQLLTEGQRGLIIVHFDQVDAAGHEYGVHHIKYREAIVHVDYLILELMGLIDPELMTVVFLSDHGFREPGHHGGSEETVVLTPVSITGKGAVMGAYPQARHADVVPTIAALLGIPQPTHADGQILVQALDFTDDQSMAAVLSESVAASASFTDLYARRLGVTPSEISAIGARGARDEDTYIAAMEQLRLIRAHARNSYLRSARINRLAVPLCLIVAGLGLIWPWLRRLKWVIVAVAAGHQLLFLGLFYARGLRFSLSLFATHDAAISFFVSRLTESAVLTLAVILAATWLVGEGSGRQAAENAAGMTLGIAWLTGVQAAAYYIAYGVTFHTVLPDLQWGVKFFIDVMQMIGIGVISPVVVVTAWIVTGLRRYRETAVMAPQPEE